MEILVGNLLKFQRKKTISLNEFIENSFIFGEFNPEGKNIISDWDRCIFYNRKNFVDILSRS